MAWVFEEPLPFVPTGRVYFSPITDNDDVYVIDGGLEFWRYNAATHTWAVLTSPNYTGPSVYRQLVPDDPDNPTVLYCLSETILAGWAQTRGYGLRISIYTIATDTWTDSVQCPLYDLFVNYTNLAGPPGFIIGETITAPSGASLEVTSDNPGVQVVGAPLSEILFIPAEVMTGTTSGKTATVGGYPAQYSSMYRNLRSLVYWDANTIYCWMGYHDNTVAPVPYSCARGRCIRFNPSAVGAPYWQVFSANDANTGVITNFGGFSAAVRNDGTRVYGGAIGPSGFDDVCEYTVATDTYAFLFPPGPTLAWAYDRDKLWYYAPADYRQGYYDVNDLSDHPDQFSECAEREAGYHVSYGLRRESVPSPTIISYVRAAAPELMSEGPYHPLVQTDPATGVT